MFGRAKREIRCPSCGTLNRVPAYSFRRIPECGKCRVKLPETTLTKVARDLYLLPRVIWLALPVALILGWFTWQQTTGHSAPHAFDHSSCKPQPRPPQGDYAIQNPLPRWAPFRVNTSAGADYLVKLENPDGAHMLSFFIYGGQPFETRVPVGIYILKYLAGRTWCGSAELFGSRATARKGDTALTFQFKDGGYAGTAVTLYLVPHGNFRTEAIAPSDF